MVSKGRPKTRGITMTDDQLEHEINRVKKMTPKALARATNKIKNHIAEKKAEGKNYCHVNLPLEVLIHFCKAGFTQSAMADQLGVSHDIVHEAFKRYGLDWSRLKAYKDTKSDVLALKQMQLLEKMTPEKMEEASLRDQATTLNILNNVEKIERGQATKITDIRILSNQLETLDKEEKRLRALLGLDGAIDAEVTEGESE